MDLLRSINQNVNWVFWYIRWAHKKLPNSPLLNNKSKIKTTTPADQEQKKKIRTTTLSDQQQINNNKKKIRTTADQDPLADQEDWRKKKGGGIYRPSNLPDHPIFSLIQEQEKKIEKAEGWVLELVPIIQSFRSKHLRIRSGVGWVGWVWFSSLLNERRKKKILERKGLRKKNSFVRFEVLRGKEKEEGELWNVLDWSAGMVGNKRGKKEKKKRKECGYVGGGGKKREKKKKESPRVWREKKIYHNIFTINLKVGYY